MKGQILGFPPTGLLNQVIYKGDVSPSVPHALELTLTQSTSAAAWAFGAPGSMCITDHRFALLCVFWFLRKWKGSTRKMQHFLQQPARKQNSL